MADDVQDDTGGPVEPELLDKKLNDSPILFAASIDWILVFVGLIPLVASIFKATIICGGCPGTKRGQVQFSSFLVFPAFVVSIPSRVSLQFA